MSNVYVTGTHTNTNTAGTSPRQTKLKVGHVRGKGNPGVECALARATPLRRGEEGSPESKLTATKH